MISEGPQTLKAGVMADKKFATTRIDYVLEKYENRKHLFK